MMTCAHCLVIQKNNPGKTARELSPVASFEAVTVIDGTAYCRVHALMAIRTIIKGDKE